MDSLTFILRVVAAFLLGSVPFAKVAMIGTGIDITRAGSGNPGFNNVLRVCRERGLSSKTLRAAIALAGDVSKGYLALLLFSGPDPSAVLLWSMGIAAVVGHCWSPWLGWNGGKGVATTAGVLLYLEPLVAAVCLPTLYPGLRWFGRKMKWKQEGAISSMTTTLVIATAVFAIWGPIAGAFAYVMVAIVVVRHLPNIREIIS